MNRLCHIARCLAVVFVFLWARQACAIDAIAVDPENTAHWHVAEKAATATFLGGDKPELAVLLLNKSKAVGQTLTIESDGTFIVVQSGSVATPHIVFQTPGKADGNSTKLKLTAGDQPSLFLNDKEQIQQQGKWIQIFSNAETTLRLEIGTATFAKVTFNPPVDIKPVPAAPVARVAAPVKDLLHPITARQLQLAVDNFHDGVAKRCTRCNGTGNVTVQYESGYERVGTLSYPTYSTRTEKCLKCNGTGIERVADDVLIKLAGTIVKDIAFVKPDDPKKQDTLTKVYSEITASMIGDQKTWACLTSNGKSILAQSSPALGTTVVSLVQVKKSIKGDDDHRRYLVRVIGTDREVYVDDPVLADELKSGHALMGGLVDKPLPDPSGEGHTTVLKGGFLIAPEITKDWYWWYKDRD